MCMMGVGHIAKTIQLGPCFLKGKGLHIMTNYVQDRVVCITKALLLEGKKVKNYD